MKVVIKREGKFNLNGKQYKKGDILEVENITDLPENWCEVVKEEKQPEKLYDVMANNEPKEESTNGNKKSANRDMGSKKR